MYNKLRKVVSTSTPTPARSMGGPATVGVEYNDIAGANGGLVIAKDALNPPTRVVVVETARAQDLTNKTIRSSDGTIPGFGFTTGAGGTVTQATNKATGVTLSKPTGQITMNAASLAADTTVAFTLTNTTIAANDYVLCQHVSAGTQAAYNVTALAGAGSATINVHNTTPGALAEAIVLKFIVIKAVNA